MDFTIEIIKNNIIKIIKHKSFQNFVIISFIAIFQLVTNVFLGRELTKDDFGLYSFIFLNIINLLSVLFLFGQSSSLLRFFSSKNIEEYEWKKYLIKFNLIVSTPILIVSFIIIKFYNLSLSWYFVIVIGLILKVSVNMITPFFRVNNLFNTAVVLERADPIPFFIFQIILYLLAYQLNLISATILKLVSFLAFIPFLFYMFNKWKSGEKKIEKEVIKNGLSLWEINLTVVVLTSIDAFFIAKLLDFKELALYNVMSSVMQIYEFTRISLFNIYSQKFSEAKNINIVKLFKLLIIIIIIISVFYLLSTHSILFLLFKGKYSASFILILLFCIYGAVNILYLIPSCFLIGQSNRKEMRQMTLINLFSLVLKIVLIYLFVDFGLNGFLTAALFSQLIRTAGGYYLVIASKKK